jgi:L-threonylcarbamoyladenylate synthase
MPVMKPFAQTVIDALKAGKIGVIPTDTIYGIVGSALNQETIARVYAVRNRDEKKSCIILIASYEDIEKCGVLITPEQRLIIESKNLWPGKVSIVLPCHNPQFGNLKRGTEGIGFRIPEAPELQKLLQQTGPLIAPSANTEGNPPATTIEEARGYFGDAVDFYVDAGTLISEPSTLISFTDHTIHVLRAGAVHIE